jgi:hypothetical protein
MFYSRFYDGHVNKKHYLSLRYLRSVRHLLSRYRRSVSQAANDGQSYRRASYRESDY